MIDGDISIFKLNKPKNKNLAQNLFWTLTTELLEALTTPILSSVYLQVKRYSSEILKKDRPHYSENKSTNEEFCTIHTSMFY